MGVYSPAPDSNLLADRAVRRSLRAASQASAGIRERKKERVRQAVLAAATTLFRERGYARAKISLIARSADIGEATLYRYFPSKRALLSEVRARALLIPCEHRLAEHTKLADHLRSLCCALGRQVLVNRWAFDLDDAPKLADSPYGLINGDLGSHLRETIREARRRGEIQNEICESQLADFLGSLLMVTVMSWTRQGCTPDPDPRIDAIVSVFFHGARDRGSTTEVSDRS
jgi:AcrR family transcriptional regulator